MKKCSSCYLIKSFDFFHKDKTQKSGYSTYCKSCKKEKDKVANLKRDYSNKNKTKFIPERKNARSKIFRALKTGKIFKQPCFICGENSEAHHPDYSKPLDVVWLCPSHHRQAHLNM